MFKRSLQGIFSGKQCPAACRLGILVTGGLIHEEDIGRRLVGVAVGGRLAARGGLAL
jgi:hypothetical protein